MVNSVKIKFGYDKEQFTQGRVPCHAKQWPTPPSRQNQLIVTPKLKPKSIASVYVFLAQASQNGPEFHNLALIASKTWSKFLSDFEKKDDPHCSKWPCCLCAWHCHYRCQCRHNFYHCCTLPTQYKSLNKIY